MTDQTAQQQGTTHADGTEASRFDPDTPHPARVYNYWLAGKDYFDADRRAAEEVIRHRPEVVAGARANRAFLARAVRYLAAGRGIRQFLDIGSPSGGPRPAPLPRPTSLRASRAMTGDPEVWASIL